MAFGVAWPQPPFSAEDLLVGVPPNLLIIIFPITLSSWQQSTATIGGKRQGWSNRGGKTLIYIPLRNWDCISLLWAVVYCVWLSNGGKKWSREGMSWLLSHQSCSLCGDLPAVPAVCSYKLGNPNKHTTMFSCRRKQIQALTHEIATKAPNQERQGQFRLGHTNTPELIFTSWDLC